MATDRLLSRLAAESLERALRVCDLLAWAGAGIDRAEILFWRTTKGAEVDLVIETGRRLLPMEVKAAATAHWLTDRVLAAPWWRVL